MSEQLGKCRSYLHSRIGIHPEGGDCIDWQPVPAPAEPAHNEMETLATITYDPKTYEMTIVNHMSAEPVAGETKPWHDGHEWVGVNAPPVAVPEGEARPSNREIRVDRLKDACEHGAKVHFWKYRDTPQYPHRVKHLAETMERNIRRICDLPEASPAIGVATPPTNPVSTDKWRVGRTVGRTLYIGDRFIGSVDTPELASKIVEAVNAGGVSTAGMTAEEFAKTWEGFRGQTSILREGKELRPLADWQEAVAIRFAQAWVAHVLAEKGK